MPPFAVRTHFATNRILWSRIILCVTVVIAIASSRPHYLNSWLQDLVELTGYALLVVAACWRVWCISFIGGAKDNQLAISGPYSIVRNPLYLGSFLGIIGFGLAVGLPGLAGTLALLFGALYPAVVALEEAYLLNRFGLDYVLYCKKVPRWIPHWSKYSEPATILVSPQKLRQGILDSMWYLWAFAFAEVLEMLRDHQVLRGFF